LFFHVQADGQSKELIGSDLFPVYASRQGAYAISEDGKTLLFVHDERLNQDNLKKKTGLYEFTHGPGVRLIDATARSGTYVNQTLPVNTIVFKKKNCPEEYCFDQPIVARTTEGKEYVLQWPNKPIKPTP